MDKKWFTSFCNFNRNAIVCIGVLFYKYGVSVAKVCCSPKTIKGTLVNDYLITGNYCGNEGMLNAFFFIPRVCQLCNS